MIDLRSEFSSPESTLDRLWKLRRVMRAGDIGAIRRIVADGLLGDDAVTGARGTRTVAVKGRLRSHLIVSMSPLYRQRSVTHGELLAHGLIESIRYGVNDACRLFIEAGADFQNPLLRRRLAQVIGFCAEKFPESLRALLELRDVGIPSPDSSDFTKVDPTEGTDMYRLFGPPSPIDPDDVSP